MKNILSTLGLENEVIDLGVNAPVNEFEEDMQEMARFCDLQETLSANSLTASLEDVEAVKAAITMKVGAEDRAEFGNMIGLENIGMEAAVDVMARQFYKIKTAIKLAVRAIIAFVKKILGLSAPTEKAFKAIKVKVKAYSKKWGKVVGSLKITKAKETRLEEAGKAIAKIKNEMEKTDPTSKEALLGTAIKALQDISTIKDIIPALENIVALNTVEETRNWITDTKAEVKEMLSVANSKSELEPTAIKTTIVTALKNIESIAKGYIESKASKKLEKLSKNLEKIQKEISKTKQSEVETLLKESAYEFERFVSTIAKGAEVVTMLPSIYGMEVKGCVQLCQIMFTEIDKVISMNEITNKNND